MPLSVQDFTIRLREVFQEVETLNDKDLGLKPEQWQAMLQQAMETIPGFPDGWLAMQAHINALVTSLEHYQTLAAQFLEEEETVKLPRIP